MKRQLAVLWMCIGTYGSGLVHMATSGSEIEHFRANPSESASLPTDRVRALAFDHDGQLWIGTHNAGVVRMIRTRN